MVDPINKFKIAEMMLASGQPYDQVVAAVAQLWEINKHEAERQLTAAGYGRNKYRKAPQDKKLDKPTESEKAADATEKPTPEKKKRAAPKSPIKWTPELEASVLAMWDTGTPVREIAKSVGGTEDAIRSRVRALLLKRRQARPTSPPPPPQQQPRQPQPEQSQQRRPSRLGRMAKRIGRDAIEIYLSQFGTVGRIIAMEMFKKDAAAQSRVAGSTETKQASTTEGVTRLAETVSRGLSETTRRIDVMADRVTAALAAAAMSARSLVRRDAIAAEAAAPVTDSTSKASSGLGLLGLGLVGSAGAGVLLASSSSARANAPPDEETQLRKRARDDRSDGADARIALKSRDSSFKADKITFDAQEIKGLGLGGAGIGEKGGAAMAMASPDAAPSPPPSWWDKTKSFFGMGGSSFGTAPGQIGAESIGPEGVSKLPDAAGLRKQLDSGFGGKSSPLSQTMSTDLSPEARGLLDTIAGSESDYGKGDPYKTIVGGRQFASFDDHPRQVGVVTSHGSSTAAGRYQFTKTTWDEMVSKYGDRFEKGPNGKVPFTPKNQDAMAWLLAQERYSRSTGRDLQADLKDPSRRSTILRQLSKEWTSLPGGIEPNSKTKSRFEELDRNIEMETKRDEEARRAATPPSSPALKDTTPDDSSVSGMPSSRDWKPAPGSVSPQSSIKDELEQFSIDNIRSSSKPSITTLSTGTDAMDDGPSKSASLDVVDPTGPTFGGGKAPVPGLDADLHGPWV